MTLAHQLGKHLHELMGWPGPMTNRQFVLWESWMNEQWNVPSRTDNQLIRIAYEVYHTVPGRQSKNLDHFRVKYGNPTGTARTSAASATMAEERLTDQAKVTSILRTGGGKVTVKTISRAEHAAQEFHPVETPEEWAARKRRNRKVEDGSAEQRPTNLDGE